MGLRMIHNGSQWNEKKFFRGISSLSSKTSFLSDALFAAKADILKIKFGQKLLQKWIYSLANLV